MALSLNRVFQSRWWKFVRVVVLLIFFYSISQLVVLAGYAINLYKSLAYRVSSDLGLSLDEITFWGIMALCALTFIGIAALGDLHLSTGITRRFRSLAKTITRFAAGAQDVRAPLDGTPEFDKLGRAFNSMADRILNNMNELKENDRLRCEMVANVAHDLGGPVTAVQGFAETLLRKDGQLSSEERLEFIRVINLNARMLGKLVAELFDLSRLEARELVPMPEPFSIETLVRDIASRMRTAFDEHRVRFEVEPHDVLPFVKADIGLVERAISNLIENSLRYTPPQGVVSIGYRPNGRQMNVSVRDTGCGIPAEDLPFVFNRFYRVNKDRSRVSGGAGLGLAIVKKIFDAHGANVTIASSVGVGTTVEFALPLADGSTPG